MNIKELGKTIFNSKVAGVVSIVFAAAGTVASALVDQKKEKDFKDLVERVKNLEGK